MNLDLHLIDIFIILAYIISILGIGFWIAKKASKNIESYFLGGNNIKWYFLGLSNASGMFDISGTMWTVSILFIYGLKSTFLPWLWPVWNQVFIMVFLAIWMRRSNVMTGAEWILTRFSGKGGKLSHIIVVCFAIISVIGFMTYFFAGVGKFATSIFPWDLTLTTSLFALTSENSYALIIIGITTLYTLKGGMYSVVATDIFQFVIMTISCIVIGYLGYSLVTAEQIAANTPAGWSDLFFNWNLDLNWGEVLPSVMNKISSDGFEMFGLLVMMMLFKGIFASLAGPVPSYDMQRILSTKSPSDAAKMSAFTMIVLYFPRFLMVAGFAALSIVYLKTELLSLGSFADFEKILPMAITKFVPIGFKGLLLAGLLASFMGTFAAFINSAPAYLVNDIYKKYINPTAKPSTYIKYSYIASLSLVIVGIVFGFFANSLNSLTLWITSSLYGGYAAANVLKWIWWRFNGYGYFFGMLSGLVASTTILFAKPSIDALFTDYFPGGSIPDIFLFPAILFISFAGAFLGTFLSKPDSDEVLMSFYKNVRPWGFWSPIKRKLQAIDPSFQGNQDFKRDMFNVVIGVIWQTSLVVIPVYLVIHSTTELWIALTIFSITSVILKFTWYDNLKNIK